MRRLTRALRNGYRQLDHLIESHPSTKSITRTATSRVSKADAQQRARFVADGAPKVFLSPEEVAARGPTNLLIAGGLLGVVGAAYYTSLQAQRKKDNDNTASSSSTTTVKPPKEEDLVNWSGTHECHVKSFYQPETVAELEALVKQAHEQGTKLRCVGSGLSPNALAFQTDGMVSLGLMDKIIHVDKATGQVRVQAGARVQDVADHLKPHGLTLQNYASIREQTMGGLTQVGAHGTGATIPTIDDSVVSLKLVTPALGAIELTKEKDPELFYLARVGLGCLGVVAELTLQCIPAYKLLEHTAVSSVKEIKEKHTEWLKENKHLRYMWIPGTESVVVVKCNPISEDTSKQPTLHQPQYTEQQRLQPLRHLLSTTSTSLPPDEINTLSATQCRDALLAIDPLNPAWVTEVNKAEAEFWKRSTGDRVGYSDEILGFDCGGEQWVLEVAFLTGTRDNPSLADLSYMEELNKLIIKHKIPAPAPIEQRWSSGSQSLLSPSHGAAEDLYSWVGIIMYLPEDTEQRRKITDSFKAYGAMVEEKLAVKYKAVEHWAKIEIPQGSNKRLKMMRERLQERYPLEKFEAARKRLDPKNILGNELMDVLLRP